MGEQANRAHLCSPSCGRPADALPGECCSGSRPGRAFRLGPALSPLLGQQGRCREGGGGMWEGCGGDGVVPVSFICWRHSFPV